MVGIEYGIQYRTEYSIEYSIECSIDYDLTVSGYSDLEAANLFYYTFREATKAQCAKSGRFRYGTKDSVNSGYD